MKYDAFKLQFKLDRFGIGKSKYIKGNVFDISYLYVANIMYFDIDAFYRKAFPTYNISDEKYIFIKKDDTYVEVFTGNPFKDEKDKANIEDLYICNKEKLGVILPLFNYKKVDGIDLNICFDEINKINEKHISKIKKNIK